MKKLKAFLCLNVAIFLPHGITKEGPIWVVLVIGLITGIFVAAAIDNLSQN